MSERGETQVNRRDFIQTGAAAAATATGVAATSISPVQASQAQEPGADKQPKLLPKRPLGKTGVEVSILNQGTWKAPDSIGRLLRMGYAGGVRYIDTAKSYGSEPDVAKYFASMPAGTRKEYFLVTKDGPRTPRELIRQLDQRLAALQTDYIDLIFIHGIGGANKLDWVKGQEFKETIDAIKKSGKAKFVGFSCHDPLKAQFLQNAAEGGFVDAIMVAYTPWLDQDAPLNRALDACHKKGIGLISMKQVSGNVNADRLQKEVLTHVPSLKDKGLTAYQGLLHAIWSDERISSCCVSMRNTDQLRENLHAATVYQPLKQAEIRAMGKAILAAGPTFCANCDGSCSRAAGTDAQLGELARLVTYHDHYGFRGEARQQYSELAETARNYAGADLDAAREACHSKLDFAALLKRVEDHLA